MMLSDIKEFFCELLRELFKSREKNFQCGLNCNCNK